MRILLIEDELSIANFIKDGLEEEGFAVDVADNGKKGLQMALDNLADYDLLLYNYEGQSLGSSQQPGNLPESLIADVAAGEYAIRVYPSIGRSPQPYEIRWRIAP